MFLLQSGRLFCLPNNSKACLWFSNFQLRRYNSYYTNEASHYNSRKFDRKFDQRVSNIEIESTPPKNSLHSLTQTYVALSNRVSPTIQFKGDRLSNFLADLIEAYLCLLNVRLNQ